MEKFGFKKSLGQNFLRDNNVINNIVGNASIDKDTLVIEIGPGQGAISKLLVPKSKFTILYEIDSRLESYLNNELKDNDNYKLIIDDFLKRDVKSDISNYDYDKLYVVANLPYYITTSIISKFIYDDILPLKIVVMVQKEVALRYSAKVGSRDYGSLTVFMNYYYDILKLFDVSRNCFVPKPNVDSAVISMSLKEDRLYVKDMDLFKRLVNDSFRYKRKNIKNNLSDYDLEKIGKVLEKYNFDLSVRAEMLGVEIFVDIANELV